MRRFIYVVLDGVGVGALPDAADYGDEGSDTFGNFSRLPAAGLPFLQSLGLGNISPPSRGAPTGGTPQALVGRLAPLSVGKDTTVGHWEQMGLVTEDAVPHLSAAAFRPTSSSEFSRRIGRQRTGQLRGVRYRDHHPTGRMSTSRPVCRSSTPPPTACFRSRPM